MKFVVEALGLTTGGGKTGLLRLLPALAAHREHDFVFLLPDLPEFNAAASPNVELILRRKPQNLAARHWFLHHTVPRICARKRSDALLAYGNFAPRRSPVPVVLLVQNAHFVYREAVAEGKMTLREKLIVAYGRAHLRRLPSHVQVIVQTEAIRAKMLSEYHLDDARVRVIPECDGLPPQLSGTLPASYGGVAPFTFLCLAVYYPHKNLEVLIEAMKKLRRYCARPAVCCITIHPDQHPGARDLLRTIARENLHKIILNVGPVPDSKLDWAYRSAHALIQPTLLETFGRTYIEAMHYGLPILTSDRDFARCVCQDAAIYFDPLNPESVARTCARIMEDESLRLRLVRNGQRLVSQLPSWEDIASRYVDLLENAAAKKLPHFSPLLHGAVTG